METQEVDKQKNVFEEILIQLEQCLNDASAPLEKAKKIDNIVFGANPQKTGIDEKCPYDAGFTAHAKQLILEIREKINETDSLLSKLT